MKQVRRIVALMGCISLLVGMIGCGSSDPNDPNSLMKELKTPRRADAIKRLSSMGEKGHVAVPLMLQIYEQGRSRADIINGLILMRATGDDVVKVMVKATSDMTEQNTAAAAADYLGDLKNPTTIKDLTVILDSGMNDEVKAAAMRSLIKFNDPALIPVFEKVVDRDVNKQWVHLNALACQGLGAIGPPAASGAIPKLIKGLFLKDRFGRMAYKDCIMALMTFGDEAGAQVLDALKGNNQEINEFARQNKYVDGLIESETIKALSLLRYEEAIPEITKQLVERTETPKGYDPTQEMHWGMIEGTRFQNAVDALGRIGDETAVGPLSQWLFKGDYIRRIRIPWALNFIGGRTAYNALLKGVQRANIEDNYGDQSPIIRLDYMTYLVQLAEIEDVPAIEKMLPALEKLPMLESYKNEPEWGQKLAKSKVVLDALNECKAVRECWIGKIKNTDKDNKIPSQVAEKAIWFLSRRADKDPMALDALLDAIRADDMNVRNASLDVLPSVCDQRCIGPVEKIMEEERGKTSYQGFKERYEFLLTQLKATNS